MRSIVFDRFGEPADVLQLRDVPVPHPGPGEILVRMLASPINPSDLLMIRGAYASAPPLPASPGFEGVGVVEKAGGGLFGKLLVGRRVAAMNRRGGNWSDYVVIRAKEAIPLASDLPLEQAAMFFVNPATAYVMTRLELKIPRGAWLLQTAAGSALGRMVIRLGRHDGFRTINVVRREEQADELKGLGGDVTLTFDAGKVEPGRLAEQVAALTDGQGVPFAIDPVGGTTGSAVVGCLAEDARLLVYGTLSGADLSVSPRLLIGLGATIEGFWLSRWMQSQGLVAKLRLVRSITRLMREGVLVSEVGKTFPLEEITAAVRHAEQPARDGKTLLQIGSQ